MKKQILKWALVLGIALLSGYGASAQRVMTRLRHDGVEIRGNRPSERHAWRDGEWGWKDKGYEWHSGAWVVPERGHAWRRGSWRRDHGGYRWRGGHWR